MDIIKSNIRIAHKDGADLAFFTELCNLYTSLSGTKDSIETNSEFIQQGDIIQLNGKELKVVEVILRLENIENEMEPNMKLSSNMNKRFKTQIDIFIEYP